ncbi:MAG: hypothetical protein NT039_03550 [Candidatus Berkelbacteria bacterium]|nr:hypothetical protein [Candidatus Berkelbacteria bacterium]
MRMEAELEKQGYLPLLQIHPWGSMIGFLLGWIHKTREPIWLSPLEAYHYVVDDKGDYGSFIAPGAPNGELRLLRVVTRKGCSSDALMVANDFVCGALKHAVYHPHDKVVSVSNAGRTRPQALESEARPSCLCP